MKRLNSLLLIVCTFSCSQNPVIQGDVNKLVVQAVLSPDLIQQTIYVSEGRNIVNIEDVPFPELDNPLSDASVIVRDSRSTTTFQETEPGIYRDLQNRLDVRPGETYLLEVIDSKGRVVTAETTVPARTQFLAPEESQVFPEQQPVQFAWQVSSGAAGYVFGELIPECSGKVSQRGIFNDLAVTAQPGATISFSKWDTVCGPEKRKIMNLRVLALDQAAAHFEWAYAFAPAGKRISNIENGFGMFGSMVSDSLFIRIENSSGPDE